LCQDRGLYDWSQRASERPGYVAEYLNGAAKESQDVSMLALGDVAEAHKVGKVALAAGVNRETLYRTLSARGNPTFATLEKHSCGGRSRNSLSGASKAETGRARQLGTRTRDRPRLPSATVHVIRHLLAPLHPPVE